MYNIQYKINAKFSYVKSETLLNETKALWDYNNV